MGQRGRVFLGIFGLICAGAVQAQGQPVAVTLCHEDVESYPWVMTGKPGYSVIQTGEVSQQLGLPIKLVPLPWTQCLEQVKNGTVDGAINASFNKERAEYAAYPLKLDGEADATRRMFRATYALYKVKGNPVTYDGTAIVNQTGVIGAQKGFSVVGQLKQLNARVDDSLGGADEILKSVVSGKFQAAALQTTEADMSLFESAELAGKIERVSKPLSEKPYFTIFNKAFAAKYPQLVRDVWRLQAKVRDSAEFKAKVVHLVKAVD